MQQQPEHDEIEEPERLLKPARMCGWMSYRANPQRKCLIKCDDEDLMQGRYDDLPEMTQRHPQAWWTERYKWRT